MRHLCLLGLFVTLTAAPAAAQSPEASAGLSHGQEIALIGIPVLATAGAVATLARLDEGSLLATALALPVVPITAVCLAGAALRTRGDCLQAVRSTALWSVPGYVLFGIGLSGAGVASLLGGGLWLAVVPPIAAYEGYRTSVSATPAVVSDPAGHRIVPGVQVRLTF